MIEKSFYCHLLYFYVLKRRNLIKESWGQVFDSITSLAVDASQHNVVDACPDIVTKGNRREIMVFLFMLVTLVYSFFILQKY